MLLELPPNCVLTVGNMPNELHNISIMLHARYEMNFVHLKGLKELKRVHGLPVRILIVNGLILTSSFVRQMVDVSNGKVIIIFEEGDPEHDVIHNVAISRDTQIFLGPIDPLAVLEALMEAGDKWFSGGSGQIESGKASLLTLKGRLEDISIELRSLRINSLGHVISQLDDVIGKIDTENFSLNDRVGLAREALSVVSGIFDALGTREGARVIIAGAVAGIIAALGWQSLAAYGITLAAWQGKDSFLKAVEAFMGQHERKKRRH
jgi:hypothetical protein